LAGEELGQAALVVGSQHEGGDAAQLVFDLLALDAEGARAGPGLTKSLPLGALARRLELQLEATQLQLGQAPGVARSSPAVVSPRGDPEGEAAEGRQGQALEHELG